MTETRLISSYFPSGKRFKYFKHLREPSLIPPRVPLSPPPLGVKVESFKEFSLVRKFHFPVDFVEVRPERFDGQDRLFSPNGRVVEVEERNVRILIEQARNSGIQLQWHFPSRLSERSLNPGVQSNWEAIFSFFKAIDRLRSEYDLGNIIALHPPALRLAGTSNAKAAQQEECFLRDFHAFLIQLGQAFPALSIGVENMPLPDARHFTLGYKIEHFERFMVGTPGNVNVLFDTGHRLLAEGEIRCAYFNDFCARHGKRVVEYHLHENHGDKDEHQFVFGKHLRVLHYLSRSVVEGIAVNLEVDVKKMVPFDLLARTAGVKGLLQAMCEEANAALCMASNDNLFLR